MPRSKLKGDFIETEESHENDSEDLGDLKTEILRLKQREEITVRKAIELEMELHSAKADRDMFHRRYDDAKSKLEQLSSLPFPVGTVEKILDSEMNRAVVKLLSGQTFVCKYDKTLDIHEGDTVALHQRSMSVIEVLPALVDSAVSAMELLERPKETYEDVGGLGEILLEIREVIELPLLHPEAYEMYNITPPSGILLYGPPGTGKTLAAKAVANATNAKFIYLAAPELVQKFIGEGARLVRDIFKIARDNAPVLIFIDEIDAIAAKRTGDSQSGEREVNRTLMQLLAEMDGFANNNQVKIIAATNRIDILDPAILRPGRFDRLIEFPVPDTKARDMILKIHMRNLPKYGIDLNEIVEKTAGFSGADLKALCTEAAMVALREKIEGNQRKRIVQSDFIKALEKIRNKRIEGEKLGLDLSKRLYS